ncbi:hypothetical protein, partial [Aromatoleum diolicum]|uniref:hypothetical protein n=1 Tax=Aromatoleum diolicum TaxID=75796 RepID=UPI001B7CFF60
VAATLGHHAYGTLTDFRGELHRLLHGSIFSRVRASTKLGAIQPRGTPQHRFIRHDSVLR